MAIDTEEDAQFVADKIRDGTLTGERKERAFAELEAFRAAPAPTEKPKNAFQLAREGAKDLDNRSAVPSMLSSAIAEPIAGFAGVVGATAGGIGKKFFGTEETGAEKGNRFVNATRDFLTIDPQNEASERALERVGKGAEVLTKGVRAPAAGLAGLVQLPFNGVEGAAGTVDRTLNEGVGPTAASFADDLGAPPFISAGIEAIPVGIVSALGVRGATRANPRIAAVSDDLEVVLKRSGIDPSDASPQNVARIQKAIDDLDASQQARIDTLKDVGVDNPTKAQVTRSADDFQQQQEVAKRSGPVRERLESQEAAISQTFDDAVTSTGGKPVTSGSTVVDEVVGRSTKLDQEISRLYAKAREQATGDVGLEGFTKKVFDNLDSDGATEGLFSAVKGELKRRGVVDDGGTVIAKVDVATAEEIRQFINKQFDAKNKTFANSEIRGLKDALDNDVFKAAGRDVFLEARAAKIDFEEGLSSAGISKFDKNTKSLVRDILENKIDPDSLVDKITSSKSYRASDLKQLRDFLNQTDEGIAAFDDLRAQVMQGIKEKSFFGPEDAQGVQALSRAKLESAVNKIGNERMNILFTVPERTLIKKLLAASKIREPVRGTALGKGPSAQAIEALNQEIKNWPVVGKLINAIKVSAEGKVVLSGTPKSASAVVSAPLEAVAVPLAVGSE